MFKKTEGSAYDVVVFQRSLDIKMEYNATDVFSVGKYFNQKEKVSVR
jgi:hypothetical protein